MEMTTASEGVLAQKERSIQSFINNQFTIKHSLPDTDNVSHNVPASGGGGSTSRTDITREEGVASHNTVKANEKGEIISSKEIVSGPTDDQKLRGPAEAAMLNSPQEKAMKEIAQVVTALGHAFTKLVDIMLSVEIKVRISRTPVDA